MTTAKIQYWCILNLRLRIENIMSGRRNGNVQMQATVFKQFSLEKSAQFLKNRKDLRGVDVLNDWRLLLTDSYIKDAVSKCAQHINKIFDGQEVVVVPILKGAICFASDLLKNLVIPTTLYTIQASSYHDAQSQTTELEVIGMINPSKLKDRKVILIDTLFDNGFTLNSVKNHLIVNGIEKDSIFTCTLFKKEKQTEYPSPDFSAMIVPDVWLVGYGLDDKQEKRGWSALYACPKGPDVPKSEGDLLFESDQAYFDEYSKLLCQLPYDD